MKPRPRMSPQEEIQAAFSNPDVICLGQADRDSTPVVVPSDESVIFTGSTGSGKSTGLRMYGVQECMKRQTAIIALDPHSQCRALGKRLTAHWSTQEELVYGVIKLHGLLKRRMVAFRMADDAGLVVDTSSWDHEVDARIVLLVDELANLMAVLKQIDQRAKNNRDFNHDPLVDMFAQVISEGRKYGFVLIATTTKFTVQLAEDPRIPIGFPIGVMLRPSDSNHAKLGLFIEDSRNPELDPQKWLRPGHAATFGASTRTMPSGFLRFQMPRFGAEHLRAASERALAQGIWVPDEYVLFNTKDQPVVSLTGRNH